MSSLAKELELPTVPPVDIDLANVICPELFETEEHRRMLKYRLTKSHLDFTRFFLNQRQGTKFIVNRHHEILSEALQQVIDGKIKRLIINMPPGYTKTEMAVINFIARGIAINPKAKFIHVSYSDALALENSSAVKEVIESEEYQALWPVALKQDTKSKKKWYTDKSGGVYAASAGGAITGFRAGHMEPGFTGAFIVDDPIKPDDAYSEVIREKICNRFTNTFQSRLAHEDIPIIVIMQRIHDADPTAFLLRGGMGCKWHHLVLPCMVNDEFRSQDYTEFEDYRIPVEVDLEDGPLWEYKKDEEDYAEMSGSDTYTTASQYQQNPVPDGGGIFKTDWWNVYETKPHCEWRIVTVDTAQKEGEHNDYTCFQEWGYLSGNAYLLSQFHGKVSSPKLVKEFIEFWKRVRGTGDAMTTNVMRAVYIEDASAGSGLIQYLQETSKEPVPVIPLTRVRDKVSRAHDVAPLVESGKVWIPDKRIAPWIVPWLSEVSKFTALLNHSHDDQVDAMIDGINMTIGTGIMRAGTW